MYPLGPAAHAVPGVICLEVFYDSRKGNCNDDDRRQWRKQEELLGPRPAEHEHKALCEVDAGSRNPGCRCERMG